MDFNDPRIAVERRAISKKEIEKHKTLNGGYSRKTLAGMGVPWPPMKGWKELLLRYGIPLMAIDTSTKKILIRSNKLANALLEEVKRRPSPIKAHPPLEPAECCGMRPSKAEKTAFYESWEWREKRMEVLCEMGKECQCCGATPGMVTPAGKPVRICVDHIRPISKYWHLRLEKKNLQILCDECNQGKGAWDETDHRR